MWKLNVINVINVINVTSRMIRCRRQCLCERLLAIGRWLLAVTTHPNHLTQTENCPRLNRENFKHQTLNLKLSNLSPVNTPHPAIKLVH